MSHGHRAEPITVMRLQSHQAELTDHAARLLGARFEAEDAVQEALMRAWRARDGFDGRAELRSWLYRICTNVCLDMLASRKRRVLLDFELSRNVAAGSAMGAMPAGERSETDPGEVVVARESVRLALAVLQRLPPKQRAVLMLREVLRWRAAEVAAFLGTSVASVNSALQRARATLPGVRAAGDPIWSDMDQDTRSRLNRYATALESSDVGALTAFVAREAM